MKNIQYRLSKKAQTRSEDGENEEIVPGSLGVHAPHQVVGSWEKVFFISCSLHVQIKKKYLLLGLYSFIDNLSLICTIISLFSSIAKVKITSKVCQTAVQIARQHLKEQNSMNLSSITVLDWATGKTHLWLWWRWGAAGRLEDVAKERGAWTCHTCFNSWKLGGARIQNNHKWPRYQFN